jgi:hypothetical protein
MEKRFSMRVKGIIGVKIELSSGEYPVWISL